MTAVLVHGVPETTRVWDALRAELERDDVVAVALPGFGCPLPDGFVPTKEGYVEWLVEEVSRVGEPVDLVGHDWGGGFVLRLASLRPDLVRSWVTDIAGMGDPGFVWHDFAKTWQQPEQGEAFMDGWLTLPIELRAASFTTTGAGAGDASPPLVADAAAAMAAALDRTMTDAILTLYRSAVQVQDEWAPDFVDIPRPGLVLLPSEDPFLDGGVARRAGLRAGATVVELEGQGHWWMLGDPGGSARLLEEHWRSAQ